MDFCSENHRTPFFSLAHSHFVFVKLRGVVALYRHRHRHNNRTCVLVYANQSKMSSIRGLQMKTIPIYRNSKHQQTTGVTHLVYIVYSIQPPEKWNFIKSQLKFLETRTCSTPLCSSSGVFSHSAISFPSHSKFTRVLGRLIPPLNISTISNN